MSCGPGQDQQVSRRLSRGLNAVVEMGLHDRTASLLDLLEKRKEEEVLNAKREEREQILERLQPRMDESQKKVDETKELLKSVNRFIKDERINQIVQRAEREKREAFEKEAEIKRLKEKNSQLMRRRQELQLKMQRLTRFPDFLQQVVKMTKFEDVRSLMGHLEALLHFRDQLYQKDSETQEKVDSLRKALLTLEDQHRLLQLHKNNQLSKLNNEKEMMRSEALTWVPYTVHKAHCQNIRSNLASVLPVYLQESKWNHIQDTAAKKTLLLVQVKMTTLNLHETTDNNIEGEEGVDFNDTETQLQKVKMFIQDHEDIRTQHLGVLDRACDGQQRTEQRSVKKNVSTAQKD
ncbi:coiled-coil domain-containing protein 42 like-2 isoform X1 [Antennarius striatus]|uniref:coiled-coil domain-containing protein 42 like-2 isoform X1 n=1 Tax=Antennarius striatus TaxID=241820 RepID=UPI0035B4EA0C